MATTAKAEETRNRILDTALGLFRERGFAHTTMRDIGAEAGAATGAAYYYFRSKEELVMAFYLRTSEEARPEFEAALASTKDLRKRLRALHDIKLRQFAEHRSLLTALLKAGVDPRDPLSPFGDETRQVRDESIAWFARAIEGADVRVPKDVAPFLPRLLWLHQMGIVYFWIVDTSPGQRRTERLLAASIELILQLLRAASLPLMGPVRKRALTVLRAMEED
jgi:AcrR family transcriptional regulator